MQRILFLSLLLAATALHAETTGFTLALPEGANLSAERTNPATSYALAIGPWRNDALVATALEGSRSDQAWRLRGNQETSLQILAPLRDQIEQAGFTVVYQCETDACGGFDFRYALDLLPEPEMHVDLGDFRYLAARNGTDWLALTVSRSSESGFVHLTTFSAGAPTQSPAPAPEASLPKPKPSSGAAQAGTLADTLDAAGKVALDDLVFASGASTLDKGEYPSLAALAEYLATRPEVRIALVGHTDTSGSLAANIALSKDRAASVRRVMIETLGVAPAQISAEGAGWLSPRTTNQTPEGRKKNRRVEAVVASTPR